MDQFDVMDNRRAQLDIIKMIDSYKVKSVTGPLADTPWKDTDFGVYYKEPKTYLRAPLDKSVFGEKSLKVFAFYCGMDTILKSKDIIQLIASPLGSIPLIFSCDSAPYSEKTTHTREIYDLVFFKDVNQVTDQSVTIGI